MGWHNRYILIIGAGLMLLSCGKFSSEQRHTGTVEESQQIKMSSKDISQPAGADMDKPEQNPDRMAPGTCRIVGKIIRILPDLEKDKSTPCGKTPCTALVRVQKVIGYGTAFNKALAANQEIKVYFSFTLNATATLFPELITPLPGLKVGDVFLTDLQHVTEAQSGEANLYKVDTYKLFSNRVVK